MIGGRKADVAVLVIALSLSLTFVMSNRDSGVIAAVVCLVIREFYMLWRAKE